MFGLMVLAASAISMPLAQAGSPSIVGSWNVTFILEPARSTGATECVVFKLVPGTVAGVPSSGTWTSPTFPGWSGQWIQLGDHVRWFGVTGSLVTTESGNIENNRIFGGVSFNHFIFPSAVTSTAGSWNAVRVSACAGTNANVGSDPAGNPSAI